MSHHTNDKKAPVVPKAPMHSVEEDGKLVLPDGTVKDVRDANAPANSGHPVRQDGKFVNPDGTPLRHPMRQVDGKFVNPDGTVTGHPGNALPLPNAPGKFIPAQHQANSPANSVINAPSHPVRQMDGKFVNVDGTIRDGNFVINADDTRQFVNLDGTVRDSKFVLNADGTYKRFDVEGDIVLPISVTITEGDAPSTQDDQRTQRSAATSIKVLFAGVMDELKASDFELTCNGLVMPLSMMLTAKSGNTEAKFTWTGIGTTWADGDYVFYYQGNNIYQFNRLSSINRAVLNQSADPHK